MIRGLLRKAREQLIGSLNASGGGFGLGGLEYPDDGRIIQGRSG